MEAKLLAVFSTGVPVKVTVLCREFEISRQTVFKYRRRFEAEGPAGLAERSRLPHSSPQRISAEIEDAIIRLRKELRVDCGAQAIAYHLARRGEIVPSVAAIHRVLVRREWGAATAQASPCCLATIRMAPAQRRLADRRHHLGPRRWANGVDHGHPRRSLSCSGRGPRRYRPHSQSHLGGLHQRRAGVGPARPCHERQWQLLHRPPGSQRGSRLRTHAALCRDQTDLLPTWPSPNVRET